MQGMFNDWQDGFREMERQGGGNGMAPAQPIGLGIQQQLSNGYVISRIMELVWLVFIHNCNGVLWPGLHGFCCWVILLFCAAFGNSEHLLAFTMAWTFLVIIRRVQAKRLWRQGVRQYSTYTGSPYVMWTFLPKLTEIQARNIEPLVCMFVSYFMLDVHQALGTLLMVSAICMGVVRIMDAQHNFRETVTISDAQVEAEQTRWRRGGWDEY
jgi:hypothetical protein